ncbi:MAG: tetratricopeptide repeat protein [Gemmatimonadetes bacterium]|nr:tetratricopeptide repeat protein [Gemmatimonadota bacterium]
MLGRETAQRQLEIFEPRAQMGHLFTRSPNRPDPLDRSLEQAIDYFDAAIDRDPRYAPAYAGKAFAYANLSALEYLPPLVAMPEAKAAAQRAIQLDNSLSEAHTWLGYAYLYFDWDWAAAERELLTALELNPNSAEARLAYGAYFASQGQLDEAVNQVLRAKEIDPKSIGVYVSGPGSQFTFLMARRYAESIEEGRRAVDLAPENSFAHGHLGLALVQNGVFGEGIAELEEATGLEDAPMLKAFLAYGYAEAGRESDARALLSEVEEISRERYTCAYEIAVVHLSLGDEDAAIEWLDKAFEDRAACIQLLNVDPRLDNLRDDSRFQELLDRVGFESSAVRAEIIGV